MFHSTLASFLQGSTLHYRVSAKHLGFSVMLSNRFLSRAAPRLATFTRKFSGDSDHAKVEAIRWYHISLGMLGLCAVTAVYNIMTHEHEHPRTDLPYMKIRNRPYPWICSDCNIFDYPCWKECRAALKGEKAEAADHH